VIESQDEDPLIRQIYEEELRKNGVSSRHLKTQSTSVKEIKVNKKHFQFDFMIATLGLSLRAGQEPNETYHQKWSLMRTQYCITARCYIDQGLTPALEADVFQAPSGTPLWKMEKAVTRKDDKGRVWGEQEKVTRRQALWRSTNWPSYHTGDEKKLGTIEVGKLAYLVVLGRDYLTVPEDEISQIPVIMTMVGGKWSMKCKGRGREHSVLARGTHG